VRHRSSSSPGGTPSSPRFLTSLRVPMAALPSARASVAQWIEQRFPKRVGRCRSGHGGRCSSLRSALASCEVALFGHKLRHSRVRAPGCPLHPPPIISCAPPGAECAARSRCRRTPCTPGRQGDDAPRSGRRSRRRTRRTGATRWSARARATRRVKGSSFARRDRDRLDYSQAATLTISANTLLGEVRARRPGYACAPVVGQVCRVISHQPPNGGVVTRFARG
jgi:hypothetical protein